MVKTSKDIVSDLLKEAAYYWYDNNEDNVKQLNPDDFDPIVDKIFKANAVELEKLYAEINESQKEIVLGLSQSLVPDQSLLPEPGYTVAQIKPKASRIHATIEDSFQIQGKSDIGEKYEYYFAPLFEHSYPNCDVVAIITDSTAIQITDNVPEVVKEISGGEESTHFWIGLDIGKLEEQDSISFFLGNNIVDEFDKNHHIFHAAKWFVNGEEDKELLVHKGIHSFLNKQSDTEPQQLFEALDISNTYEKMIFSRLKNSFIQVSFPFDIRNDKYQVPPLLDGTDLTSTLEINSPICWVKVEFPLALPNDYLLKNILYPNTIPLVNRQLKDNFVVKSNYDRILLPMPTDDFFLDVHKIQDAKNKDEDPETEYQKVDFLNPDSQPGTFTQRSGARIRRLNRADASSQIYRLMGVIQEEYSTFKEDGVNRLKEDFDIIEKSINRIKSQLPDYFRDQNTGSSYYCIANFRPNVSKLYCYYWQTQGEAIKHLRDTIALEVTSEDINIAGSKSIIPIQHGKGIINPDDFINQLKISLLSRGRIMTKGDIELYCNSRYRNLLKVENISRQLMNLEEGKRGRGILVNVKIASELTKEEGELIRVELQNDLNAKSAFFTLIKVESNHEK